MDEKELIDKMFRLSVRLKTEATEIPSFNKLSEGEKGIIGWLCKVYPNPVISGNIAEIMKIGTGRVGNALKSLEKKGIITRRKDDEDLRKVYVSLTDKGYEYGMHIRNVIEKFMTELIDEVSVERFERFLSDFEDIVEVGKKLRKRKEYQNVW